MTGKLDRLEALGFLERTPDATDRRAVRLTLTDEGRRVVEHAFELGQRLYERMLDGIGPAERTQLDKRLTQVLGRLDHLHGLRHPWEAEA